MVDLVLKVEGAGTSLETRSFLLVWVLQARCFSAPCIPLTASSLVV